MKIDDRVAKILATLCLTLFFGIAAGALAWSAYLPLFAVTVIAIGGAIAGNAVIAWINHVDKNRPTS